MPRHRSPWSRTFRPRLDRLEGREVPAIFTVTTASDDPNDPGLTLREAIELANSSPGADEIRFAVPAGSTITVSPFTFVPPESLQGPLPVISEALTITGPGKAALTVSGGKQVRVFHADAALTVTGLTIADGLVSDGGSGGGILAATDLTLTGVTVRNNAATGFGDGGGVFLSAGTLRVDDVLFLNNTAGGDGGGVAFGGGTGGLVAPAAAAPTVFRGNRAGAGSFFGRGGGLYLSDRTLTATGLVFDGNTATGSGGGLAAGFGDGNAGSVTLADATFTANTAGEGGGAALFDVTGTISGSTFAGNSATGGGEFVGNRGGGLLAVESLVSTLALRVVNSTFAGNTAAGAGGGVAVVRNTALSAPFLTLASVTVTANRAGGNGAGLTSFAGSSGAPVALVNSILAGNTSTGFADDVGGAIVSLGTNLYGTFSGPAPGFGATDIQTTDARLDELAGNGGPTQTVALLAGSPALGAGNPAAANAPAVDQRGRPRPLVAGQYDIGAFQAQRPTAAPDSYTLPFNGGTIPAPGVLANDQANDIYGPLTAVLVAPPPPAAGALVFNADGSFTFTPAAGFSGPTTFTYRASDGVTSSPITTVSLTITPPVPPTAVPDTFTFPFDGGAVAAPGVLANDTPGSGGPLTAVLVAPPPTVAGTLTFNPDGSFTFVPLLGFSGIATFVYRAFDGVSFSADTIVTLTVVIVPPVANPDTFTAPPGQTLVVAAPGILANDTRGDGSGPLTAVFVSPIAPAGAGTLSVAADGGFTFTPAFGFFGTAGFNYQVNDGLSTGGTPATVFIRVQAPPTAVDDRYAVPAGGLFVPPSGVLGNDIRNSGSGGLVATLVQDVPAGTGTLVFNPDGSFAFTPTPGFASPVTFRYTATDLAGTSAPATVTLDIGAAPTLVAPDRSYGPVTAGTPLTVAAAQGLLSGVESPTGLPLRVINAFPSVGAGTLSVAADGGFTFTPPADAATGSVTFNYQLTDDVGQPSNIATATVAVTATGVPTPVTRFTAYATGAGVRARVRVVRPGQPDLDLRPFEDTFLGGARVAVADVNRDGVDDVVVAAGPTGGPRVIVYDGRTGGQIANFFAFEESFRGGAHVAAADAVTPTNARTSLLVVGAGSFSVQPGGPRVRAFVDFQNLPGEASQGVAPIDFIAYDPRFQGGVRVAAGDLDGNGTIEIVTIAGPSGGPDLRVWDTGRLAGTQPALRQQLSGLGAGNDGYRGGAFVAVSGGAVVVTPDSFPDLANTELSAQGGTLTDTGGAGSAGISAATTSRPPAVYVFLPTAPGSGTVGPDPLAFDLGDPGFLGGVRVTAGATPGGGGGAAVLVGYGQGGNGRVRQFAFNPAGGAAGGVQQVLDRTTETDVFPFGDLGPDVSVYVGLAPLPVPRAAVSR